MGVNLRRRECARALGHDLDSVIEQVLAEHGPQDAMSLVRRVGRGPGEVAPRVCELVVSRRVRVDGQGRFELHGGDR